MCPLNGKSDLDRRFSSLTSWITTFQYSQLIDSVEKMRDVLVGGHKGSNIKRLELGMR